MGNLPLLHCENLTLDSDLNFASSKTINLEARAGEIISIIGPARESKSYWLQTIGGIMEAGSGQLLISNKNTQQFDKDDWVRARREFAYLHADTAILSAANALQNLMLPAMYHKIGPAEDLRIKAQLLLTEIEAGENLELLPAYLDKEQRYKIATARALMLNPKALLIENPFRSLEHASVKAFQQFLLNRVKNQNMLLILVTHNIKFALKHSDQIIYVSDQTMLQFDRDNQIQHCNIQEVRDYLDA